MKDIKTLFQNAIYQPPAGLQQELWRKLELRIARRARIQLTLCAISSVVSVVAFVPMFRLLLSDFAQSGFYEYISLAFNSNAISSWRELGLSIAESLPTTSITLSLLFIFTFILSIRYLVKPIIKNQLSVAI